MKRALTALFCFSLTLHAPAVQAQMSANDAFNEGSSFGTARNAEVRAGVKKEAAEVVVPNYSASSERSALYGGMKNLDPDGHMEKAYCAADGLTSPDPKQVEACQAVNTLAKINETGNPFSINKATDPIMVKKREIQADPTSFTGMPFGTSLSECTNETVTGSSITREETCFDAIPLPTSSSCQMPQEVEVLQHNRYSCLTGKKSEAYACSDVLSVVCAPAADGCDSGGLVPASWAGDMAISWTNIGSGNYQLQFGTIGDNYWPGNGTIYDRTLQVQVNNVSNITAFLLAYAQFDDYLLVRVNGHLVYVGPYGGDRLEVVTTCIENEATGTFCYKQVQTCATCFRSAELETNWQFNLSVDLRPYLKEGLNEIFTRTVVAGDGESAIRITTRQKCPADCTVSWNKTACSPYR